jgi:hypothetical protein
VYKKILAGCLPLSLVLLGVGIGRLLPGAVAREPQAFTPALMHAHAGPTIEQVRGLSSLTVLKVDVADVQVTELRGYTGGAKAALVVKGDLTLSTDLSQARFDLLDPQHRRAVLVLPPPQVASPRVDHARTRLLGVWRYGLWQVVPGDRAETTAVNRAFGEAQQVVAAAGGESSLDGRGKAQAEAALRAFFLALGWDVAVRWSDRPRP